MYSEVTTETIEEIENLKEKMTNDEYKIHIIKIIKQNVAKQ